MRNHRPFDEEQARRGDDPHEQRRWLGHRGRSDCDRAIDRRERELFAVEIVDCVRPFIPARIETSTAPFGVPAATVNLTCSMPNSDVGALDTVTVPGAVMSPSATIKSVVGKEPMVNGGADWKVVKM
jgi:hypothetical protein